MFGAEPTRIAITNPDLKLARHFGSIGQMAEEICLGRIWAGVHFRNSLSVNDMGRKIAAYLIQNAVTPLP